MTSPLPSGFPRIPGDEWTEAPLDTSAQAYDVLERHGWYANLDPTVEALAARISNGDLVLDYSGGTGILERRLFGGGAAAGPAGSDAPGSPAAAVPSSPQVGPPTGTKVGLVIVDSSPKFLRVALERLRDEPRVAFRQIRWLSEEKRLEHPHEVLGPLVGRLAGVVSTNAIHLYRDLSDTLASWAACLRGGGWVHVQSGNLDRPGRAKGVWTIDATVHAIAEAAVGIAAEDDRWQAYREAVDDEERMAAHDAFREKVFLPLKPVSHYVEHLDAAGLPVEDVQHRSIPVDRKEWVEFLSVYHDAILGWVGGTKKVEGRDATDEAVRDRLLLLEAAAAKVLPAEFPAEWTYLEARKA